MWVMAYVFEKRPKYVGNDVDMWEMAKICAKWLKFDKRIKYVRNNLQIWEMAKLFGKWLRFIGHGLSI